VLSFGFDTLFAKRAFAESFKLLAFVFNDFRYVLSEDSIFFAKVFSNINPVVAELVKFVIGFASKGL